MSEDFDLGGYAEPSGEGGNFLRAADLEGKIVNKKVASVSVEQFDDGQKPVLHFDDDTALVVNKTNAGFLARRGLTPLGKCVGATLELETVTTNFKGPDGQPMPGIRIAAVE